MAGRGILPTMRYKDWASRLAQVLADRQFEPFAFGSNDCCLFAADCTYAMTGHDPAADVRESYLTALQAQKLIDKLGGIEQIAAAWFGPEITPALMQVGDIAMVYSEGRETLSVYTGNGVCAPGKEGLVTVSVEEVRRAWRCCKEV